MERYMILLTLFFLVNRMVKGQTIDELIDRARTEMQGYNLMSPVKDGSGKTMVMIEGDIMMDMDEYVEMERERADEEKGRRKRKARSGRNGLWPDGVVPYEISREISSSQDIQQIQLAINNWNRNTCLRIRPAQSNDENRIRFVNGGGCSSFIGAIGGVQDVTLASGCRFKRIVEHEVGHAIGFYHEQSRPDRDQFVQILEQNVQTALLNNFRRQPSSRVNDQGVPYDYRSVMHYGQRAFSANGQITIRTVDSAFQNKIGQSEGLSFRDFKLANLMYSCNSECQAVTCPGEGFQAEDCNCRCPSGDENNPLQVCDAIGGSTRAPTTRRPTTTPMDVTCMDSNSLCGFFANRGYCQGSFRGYMTTNCQQSCNTCTSTLPQSTCMDMSTNCEYWKSRGYCEMTFVRYMQTNCEKTCGVCTPQSDQNQNQANENVNTRNGSSEMSRSAFVLTFFCFFSINARL